MIPHENFLIQCYAIEYESKLFHFHTNFQFQIFFSYLFYIDCSNSNAIKLENVCYTLFKINNLKNLSQLNNECNKQNLSTINIEESVLYRDIDNLLALFNLFRNFHIYSSIH